MDDELTRPREKGESLPEYRYRMRLLVIRHYMGRGRKIGCQCEGCRCVGQSLVPKWAYMPTAGAVAA